ncbi:FemAB family XrtA/PEP-CTERM system-associated protein [Stieleria mannarensis]|uniref:FemAB family XrtA/PEP-CTERM system-associated protein n=1 Tax=Stieleria mannarensis TaxID=2755585 RepID=UPI001603A81D|nr:FemAB family XrtA/PEP-CTERM system-associated protein [Rhodopirellula sp. JC639]
MVSSASTPATAIATERGSHAGAGLSIEVIDSVDGVREFRERWGAEATFDVSRSQDLQWLEAICLGLRHRPFLIVARRDGAMVGKLPLIAVRSLLFGKFLVSLPYVNTSGVNAVDDHVAGHLVDHAADLADKLDVRHLELRHELELSHAKLGSTLTSKVHMRLPLPKTQDELWSQFKSKVRNKVKKGDRQEFDLQWGAEGQLAGFYDVFSRTMRDLGTPVYSQELFRSILSVFGGDAELCVVRKQDRPAAVALLIHGPESTFVPSAASLHELNSTNVNDWMYWQLLKRAIERGKPVFDFGRCTPEGNTFTFKKKWGAEPEPAVWQYYVRQGNVTDVRPEGGKYDRAVDLWKKLPLPLTRLIGPSIVRGIP